MPGFELSINVSGEKEEKREKVLTKIKLAKIYNPKVAAKLNTIFLIIRFMKKSTNPSGPFFSLARASIQYRL